MKLSAWHLRSSRSFVPLTSKGLLLLADMKETEVLSIKNESLRYMVNSLAHLYDLLLMVLKELLSSTCTKGC